MRVRTCEAGDVFDVFTRVVDTCEVLDSSAARVCVCYSGVSHVCVYTMLGSTTEGQGAIIFKGDESPTRAPLYTVLPRDIYS